MRYYYKNKNSDFYNPSWLENPLIWIIVSLVIAVLSYIAIERGYSLGGLLIDSCTVSVVVFVAVTGWQLYQVKRYLGTFRHLISYFVNYGLVQAIDTSILNSKSSAGMVNKSYRVLPKVWLWYNSSTLEYKIRVQKLAGTYETDLDHVGELVSSALGDRYKITSKKVSQDQSWFEFTASLVEQNLRFVPRSIDELKQPPYKVRLMNNLTIDFAKLPHLATFGETGGGKTTVLWVIILQVISNSELYFVDLKNEFSVLSSFYPSDRFAIDSGAILQMLQSIVSIMNYRKKVVNREAKRRGVIGLTGYELGFKPVYLVVDEFSSVLKSFGSTTEERKKRKQCEDLLAQILMQSRAYSIIVLYSSQSPSTEVLSQEMREQFGTYVLLGTAKPEVQRMAFGQVATNGNLDKFEGYYIQSRADMATPQLFEVPDIFKYRLNTVAVFKQLYRKEN